MLKGCKNMLKQQNAASPVKFFPIFTAATLSVLIDSIRLLVNETVVGNLFNDTAFAAINLVEPYMILVEFFSYLICVGGTAMLVRARSAEKPEEMQQLLNHCVTCCLIIGLFFFALFSLFDEWFVRLVTQNSAAYPYTLEAFFWERFYLMLLPLYVFLFTYVLYFDGALVDSITMVLMTVVDTGLSIVLGRKLGIGGVTCATFIAHCLGVLILGLFVIAKNRGFPYRPYVNPGYIKKLTPLGLPVSCFLLSLVIVEAGVNALALKTRYEYSGAIFHTTTDSEIIAYAIAQERLRCGSVEQAVNRAVKHLRGAFSLIIMSPQKLIGIRDPQGLKPLCIGRVGDSYILASESAGYITGQAIGIDGGFGQ